MVVILMSTNTQLDKGRVLQQKKRGDTQSPRFFLFSRMFELLRIHMVHHLKIFVFNNQLIAVCSRSKAVN